MSPVSTAGRKDRSLPVLTLLSAASGAAALIYEVVWLQLFQLVIGSSAISVGVLLGTFMGGMSLGSAVLPRLIGERRHALHVFAALELTIATCALGVVSVLPAATRLYTAWGGDSASGFALRAALAVVCLLPATMAMFAE
jgi:spermidine synthase